MNSHPHELSALTPFDSLSQESARAADADYRRIPRRSLIIALAENHTVSAHQVTASLLALGSDENVDVILACAGQPIGISALQRALRSLQILLAPAGTSAEDLRELAMKQATGDIVTLLSGRPVLAEEANGAAQDNVTAAV